MSNIAISYARYSSQGQSEGNSLARQLEEAELYALANDLVIDRQLSFRDLGVSGWDGSNIEKGALGLFLKAIQAGKIPSGATLIVESFDRLSRAEPMDALPIFVSILNANLKIVTLTKPPKLFSRETIRANHFQLFEALIEMSRANKESELKSERLSSSWASRRKRAVAENLPMTSKAPHWIRAEGPPRDRTFHLIPERAAVVQRIIDMAKAGVGNHTIIKTLNEEGVPSWPRSEKEEAKRNEKGQKHQWAPSYIQKMLTKPALYGDMVVKGAITVRDHYPPVMTKDEFILLQAKRAPRATRKTTSRKGKSVTNLFSGLLRCGYCGADMGLSGYTARKTGIQQKYFACQGARTGSTACRMYSWPVEELEPVLLFWLTQIDYGKLIGTKGHGDIDAERRELAVLEAEIARLKLAVENGNIAIDQGVLSQIPRVKENEAKLIDAEKQLKDQERKVAVLVNEEGGGGGRTADLVRLFKTLKHTTEEVPLRALREQLSAAIEQVVQRITLFPKGHNANETKDDRFVDVLFKNGAARRIEAGEC